MGFIISIFTCFESVYTGTLRGLFDDVDVHAQKPVLQSPTAGQRFLVYIVDDNSLLTLLLHLATTIFSPLDIFFILIVCFIFSVALFVSA